MNEQWVAGLGRDDVVAANTGLKHYFLSLCFAAETCNVTRLKDHLHGKALMHPRCRQYEIFAVVSARCRKMSTRLQ
jgi:hypothetical protein